MIITKTNQSPKSISTEQNTSSNDSDDSPFHSTKSSYTSRDSHGLQIDESKLNSRIDTDDASHQVDAISPMNISDEDEQTKISDEDEQTKKIVPYSYSLNLPTVKQLMAQRSVPKLSSEQSRDEQLKSAGQFAKAVMRSPYGNKDHTLEKENQYKEGVKGRTIYGSYHSENGDLPYIDPKELLKAIIKHIDKDHIEAFYKTAGYKFVIVLKDAQLKETYSLRVQFRKQVQNIPLNFVISPNYLSKKKEPKLLWHQI